MWLKYLCDVTKMRFDVDWHCEFLWRLREMCDVVTKIKVCVYSKNRLTVSCVDRNNPLLEITNKTYR